MTPELNRDEIPEYWQVVEDPYLVHSDVRVLQYFTNPEADPAGIISAEPVEADPDESFDGEWAVEVQDIDADGPGMNYPNPLVVRETFDSPEDAYERVVELSQDFPIREQEGE